MESDILSGEKKKNFACFAKDPTIKKTVPKCIIYHYIINKKH